MWQQQGQRLGQPHHLREAWPGAVVGQQNAPSAEGVGEVACSAFAATVVAGGLKAAWG